MRLIDADALKEELGIAEDCDDCERLGAHGCVNSTWAIVCDRIESAPTIDVAPVRHGRWEECGKTWSCSECGSETGLRWDYCPDCGAKMDGGDDDEKRQV